jgi:hypothetical protein
MAFDNLTSNLDATNGMKDFFGKKVTVSLPPDLWTQFQRRCDADGMVVKRAVAAALFRFLRVPAHGDVDEYRDVYVNYPITGGHAADYSTMPPKPNPDWVKPEGTFGGLISHGAGENDAALNVRRQDDVFSSLREADKRTARHAPGGRKKAQ